MFRKNRKTESATGRIDSLIGKGVEITGEVAFKGGLRLEGRVNGSIVLAPGCEGTLVVGPQGIVDGDVRVTHLIIDGTVKGSAYAEKGVELGPTARVLGNVHYGSLEMHAGAVFEGHMISHQTPLLDCVVPSGELIDYQPETTNSGVA